MYESPIKTYQKQLQMQFEGEVLRAIQRVGVTVDKHELLRALTYDRDQYQKGYQDAMDGKEYMPRRGQWIPVRDKHGCMVGVKCSECGRRVRNIGENYCPRCGVKMGEE